MARWHFYNFRQLLCLGSAKTRSKKGLYASVQKKSVPKVAHMLRLHRPEAKNVASYFKNVVAVTSLVSGGTEPGPNRVICLDY